MVPSITGGGGSLEFKKLNASDISGVMSNPATADLNMNNWGISNVPNISNGGGAMQLSSNGNLFLTSASEVQIQPSSGANIVLECASTGGPGDIFLRWPDANSNHNIQIGNNNTIGGNKQVLIMTGVYTAGISSLNMGSGTLTLAKLNARSTTISGQNTMAISGPNITIGVGSANTDVRIGTGTNNANITIGNANAGSQASLTSETTTVTGTDRLNLVSYAGGQIRMYANGAADIYIGSQAADKIGFRGAPPIPQNQMVIGTNLPNANAAYQQTQMQAVINKVNAIRESLVTVGLCQV